MVELQKKYQIGKRRFGLINWVGTFSLFKKEVLTDKEDEVPQFIDNKIKSA